MAQTFSGRSWTLTHEQRGEWVTMGIPTADERWRATDSNGHEHYYDHGYPTLELVIDESHWCDGREGLYSHDPHEAVDASHYECKECRETLEPSTHGPDHRVYMAGPSDYTLAGPRTDGMLIEAYLLPEQVDRITNAAPDQIDVIAQALLDEMPDDQIRSMQFASR